ncbi:MAG: hypothetical protein GXP30_01685 [Verrucomicrobia bacterium]|nr:hypothetical protein [Verrucomicrobiota bacterium]
MPLGYDRAKKTRTQLREDWSNKRRSEQKLRKRLDVDVSSTLWESFAVKWP